MTNRRCWRRINKPKFDYELKGRCDPVVGVAILFSVYAPEGCERLYRICANLPYYAHMNTYSDPPMALADAKKMARAWVKANERPNAPYEGPSASGRPREGQDMTHRWNWRKWLPERHGQLCRVLATGRMNSALVEFEDGTKVVTSRYAVRKLTHNAALSGAEPALSAERPR